MKEVSTMIHVMNRIATDLGKIGTQLWTGEYLKPEAPPAPAQIVKQWTNPGGDEGSYLDESVQHHGSMPFQLGGIKGTVYGGSYNGVGRMSARGVKMAVEIDKDCLIDVPTVDFNIPNVEVLRMGVLKALIYLNRCGELYVGCWGGIGRTGIFMAALAKCMDSAGESMGPLPAGTELPAAVLYVRKHYKAHALETKQQIELIRTLRVDDLVDAAFSL